MIRLSANISKKVPLPNIEFSSQQFGVSMEIEIGRTDQPEAIHAHIRELYAMLNQAVDVQIGQQQPHAASHQQPAALPPPPQQPQQQYAQPNGNGGYPRNRIQQYNGEPTSTNGGYRRGGNRSQATQAQQKAIFAITKQLGVNMREVLAPFNVTDAGELSVKDASRLIDDLKSRQNAHQ